MESQVFKITVVSEGVTEWYFVSAMKAKRRDGGEMVLIFDSSGDRMAVPLNDVTRVALLNPGSVVDETKEKGEVMEFLRGKKTYLTGLGVVLTAVGMFLTGDIEAGAALQMVSTALIGIFLRSGING